MEDKRVNIQSGVNETNLKDKVELIVDQIYKVNEIADELMGKEIFHASWEDSKRYAILKRTCSDEVTMAEFAKTLYTFIYEETKEGKTTLSTLPKSIKNDLFVEIVGEYRHHFSHGVAEYNSKKIPITEINFRYLGTNMSPKTADDFFKMQVGLLTDYSEFLERLFVIVAKNRVVIGVIRIDDNDNVYCQDVVLPHVFKRFEGCKCRIPSVKPLTVETLKGKYKNYASIITDVEYTYSNKIWETDNKILCGPIQLPEKYIAYRKYSATITKVDSSYQHSEMKILAKSFSIDLKQSPTFGKLEYDNGRPFVNGLLLVGKEWMDLKGDFLLRITRIECFTQESELIGTAIATIYEGIVTMTFSGSFHCGNVKIDNEIGRKYYKKRVRLGKTIPNLDTRSFPYYTRFAQPVDGEDNKSETVVEEETNAAKASTQETPSNKETEKHFWEQDDFKELVNQFKDAKKKQKPLNIKDVIKGAYESIVEAPKNIKMLIKYISKKK